MIELNNVTVKAGSKILLNTLNYQFHPGNNYIICGPNGAGKSTLLKVLSQELQPQEGTVYVDGKIIKPRDRFRLATSRAVLSQHTEIIFPMPVEEVVLMGRYPHFSYRPSENDLAICKESMRIADVIDLRSRNYLTLSGGEKQRVQFARVLAQLGDTPGGLRILLLDEPLSSLDLEHQFNFMEQVKAFIDERTIVITVLHDLNLCLRYADRILLMNNGNLVASGDPREILSPELIMQVFKVESHFWMHEGAKQISFSQRVR